MVPPPAPAWGRVPVSPFVRVLVLAITFLYGIAMILNNNWKPQGYEEKDIHVVERALSDEPLTTLDLREDAMGGGLRKKVIQQEGKSHDEEAYWRARKRRDDALMKMSNSTSSITVYDEGTGVSIWDWFTPDYNCPSTMQRLGGLGVGGKWVCGLQALKDRGRDRPCVIYSFGMRGNISFELEASNHTGCQVYVYDPSRPGLPEVAANTTLPIEFHKEALGITSGPTTTSFMTRSFHDIMREKGHDFVDIVKIDIDGAEWGIFQLGLFTQGPLPFGQLLINLHYKDVPTTFNFFQQMEKSGFRIFSREVDSEPQIKPGVPPSMEYSLINPSTFGKNDPKVTAYLRALPPYQRRMNGVVYFLTQRSRMTKIKEMLRLFDKNFNSQYRYPMMVFHDDLSPADQQQIRSFTTSNITFREIHFKLPEWLDPAIVPERTVCSPLSSTLGYRHMCRFLAMQVQDLLKDFEWHWRIDDDSLFLSPIGYDVFRLMSENNKKYGFNRVMMDGPDCVSGLWDTARKFLDTLPEGTKSAVTLFDGWLDGAAFYNNFEISHASLWRDPVVKSFLDYIDRDGGIYTIRWGDAPIRTVAVTLVLKEKDLHYFSDIAYVHKPFQNTTAAPLPDPTVGALEHLDMANEYKLALVEDWTAYVGAGSFDTRLAKPPGVIYLIGSPDRLNSLVRTLSSLDKYFNRKFDYPVWVFAHGLTYEDRLALRSAINTTQFTIKEVPFPLDLTASDDPGCPRMTDGRASWYRSFEIPRRLARRYEWLWHLSDDMVLTQHVEEDPFRALRSAGALYGTLSTSPLPGGILHDCFSDLNGHAKAALQAQLWSEDRITMLLQALSTSYFTGDCDISHRQLWTSNAYKDLGARLQTSQTGWVPGIVQTLGAAMGFKPGQARLLNGITAIKAPEDGALPKHPVRVPHAVQLPGVAIKVIRETAARELFRPQPVGFLYGDVALALPSSNYISGRSPDTLWLFGSTTLGTKISTQPLGNPAYTLRNAAGVSDLHSFLVDEDEEENHVEVYWQDNNLDGSPDTLLQLNNKPGQALLPLSGIWVHTEQASPELLLLCRRYNDSFEANDPAGFLGSSLARVTQAALAPRKWHVQVRDVTGTDSTHTWHSSMVLEDGSYVSRHPDQDKVVVMGELLGRSTQGAAPCHRLARISVQKLINFIAGGDKLSDNAWEPIGGAAGCLFGEAHGQASRVSVIHHPNHNLWMVGDIDQERELLVLHVASSLSGPWTTVPALDLSSHYYRAGYTCHRALPVPWASPQATDEVVMALLCNEQSLTLSLRQRPVLLDLVRLRFLSQREISAQ